MKIKHFAGYGTVQVKKVSDTRLASTRIITIAVAGNHEYGLQRPFFDPMCIHNWIGKRYAKDKQWFDLKDYCVVKHGYARNDVTGVDEEYAVYRLVYDECENM